MEAWTCRACSVCCIVLYVVRQGRGKETDLLVWLLVLCIVLNALGSCMTLFLTYGCCFFVSSVRSLIWRRSTMVRRCEPSSNT